MQENKGNKRKQMKKIMIAAATAAMMAVTACEGMPGAEDTSSAEPAAEQEAQTAAGAVSEQTEEYESVSDVPEYNGEPYVEINDNQPDFTEEELTTVSYEEYSQLDELGRCGTAQACIGEDLMPTEERESISDVKPTGWENERYDVVDGGYLYNRCHLIGFQLSGENANEENLITGTRYMNTEGMLPFEDEVADYVRDTENHVMYRVTPVFEGEDLVASGVQMEAESVEDKGQGICFNVYVYNVQPDITIDYTTGYSWVTTEEEDQASGEAEEQSEQTYILNTNTHKFHLPDCSSAADIKEKNRKEFTGSREEVVGQGYEPCSRCKP